MPSNDSKKMLWTGRVLSGLIVLLMLLAALPKLFALPAVVEGFQRAGFAQPLIPVVGILEAVSTLLYLIPRTRVLGAILLTGVLGGAVATNVRIQDPTWIAPAALGILAWAGLFLRDARLRALLPLRAESR